MSTTQPIYRIKTSSLESIYLHLQACSTSFNQPLSDRIDLKDYSSKIYHNAITFEVWDNDVLVGLLAAYFNQATECAFITNVSLLKSFMGLGLASELLAMCIDRALTENIREVKLEVDRENVQALKLYNRFQFEEVGEKDGRLLLSRNLSGPKNEFRML